MSGEVSTCCRLPRAPVGGPQRRPQCGGAHRRPQWGGHTGGPIVRCSQVEVTHVPWGGHSCLNL